MNILLIQETKMLIEKLEVLKNYFFKDCGLHGMSFARASCGIGTFWNPKVIEGVSIVDGFNHMETKFSLLGDLFS
jgi:hypothetical protein